MHHSACFSHERTDTNKNQFWKCVHDGGCITVVRGVETLLKAHAAKHGLVWLTKFQDNMAVGTTLANFGIHPTTRDENLAKAMENDLIGGDPDNFRHRIARFIILQRLALRVADATAFRVLLLTAINYGAMHGAVHLDQRVLPSRHTLVDIIEGDKGVLSQAVTKTVKRLEANCRNFSAQLVTDSATDAQGKSVEVVFLMSNGAKCLLGSVVPAPGHRKDAEWTTRVLTCILKGQLDFDRMSFKEVNEPEEEEIEAHRHARCSYWDGTSKKEQDCQRGDTFGTTVCPREVRMRGRQR
jgi:hypothetical protein